ncbi:MAG: glycoside hydrolase family 3 C-terminal domain-containing protein [Brevefilum sp.]|nr:glycoside hydrolase family 3 C-terminal domain-containing protein [Brevefilum sp.]
MADVILGDLAFTEKLPKTWPVSIDQLPIGRGVGDPLFPFGLGFVE